MKKTIKILSLLAAMLMLMFVFAACGENEPEDDPQTGMANPWSDVSSTEEAAKGAGLDTFVVPEGVEISLGVIKVEAYRCMDGIAEVQVPFPAVDMTIRKGRTDAAVEEGDISGDYGEYKYSWTQNVKGLEVTCFGNREGESTRTIWQSGEYLYSIVAYGEGGDTDYGLPADDLNEIINGMQ